VTNFPPLDDELRPKVRLKRHADVPPATDEEVEANSRQIGEKWGATTSMPPAEPAPPPAPQPAKVTSIRGYIPQYLDDELTRKAAERRVTKTFLIMEALAKAGYRVDEIDLVQDRRKKDRGN
jgi:hypothetical protein